MFWNMMLNAVNEQ